MVFRNLLRHCLFLLSVGCFLAVAFLLIQRFRPKPKILAPSQQELINLNLPIQLTINDLGIFLPVYPVSNPNRQEETTTQGVSYLLESALPGQVGNSIFYGHNWPNLLGPLTQASPGQEIDLKLAGGQTQKYKINQIELIPSNHNYHPPQDQVARLIIYTCAGFFDQKRLVVLANPL